MPILGEEEEAMDELGSSRRGQAKLVIAVYFVLLVFYSGVELRYIFFGKTARALVTQTNRYTTCTKSGTHTTVAIQYQFTEPSGKLRVESDKVEADGSEPTLGEAIKVEYCPGSAGMSRIAGHNAAIILAISLFLFAVGFLVVAAYQGLKQVEAERTRQLFDSLAR
jgi:hypothetical protein